MLGYNEYEAQSCMETDSYWTVGGSI